MLATEAIQLESCLCVEVEIGWVRVVSKDWPSYVIFRRIEQPTSHGIVCFSRKFDTHLDPRPLILLMCCQRRNICVPSRSSHGNISPTSLRFFGGNPKLQTLFTIDVAEPDKSGSISTGVRSIAAILLSGSSWCQFLFSSSLSGKLSVCCVQHRFTSAEY